MQKEREMTNITTQPNYPTWFKNPLNTKIRIGEHGHLLSDESYWQATVLSKDHVLVEMHFFMNLESFLTNDDVSNALSSLFPYDYSSMIEDIIKGVPGTRDSFIKDKKDKRKVLLLTPLGVCSPSVVCDNDGGLIAAWKSILLVTDSKSHEELKHIVDVIRSAGCKLPQTVVYTTRTWRSEGAWEKKVTKTHGERYLDYLNIHHNSILDYLSWLDFKWDNLNDSLFDSHNNNCTKWLTQSIIDLRDKAKNEQEQVGHQS